MRAREKKKKKKKERKRLIVDRKQYLKVLITGNSAVYLFLTVSETE